MARGRLGGRNFEYLGFDGLVMTDWFGGRDAVAQMKAGNELLMPGTELQRKANTSYSMITGGTGSGDVNEAYSVSLVEGLKAAGFAIDGALAGSYEQHIQEEQKKALLQDVANAFRAQKKKLLVVLNIGGVIETASWRDVPDAILLAWQPGQEAGHAVG